MSLTHPHSVENSGLLRNFFTGATIEGEGQEGAELLNVRRDVKALPQGTGFRGGFFQP